VSLLHLSSAIAGGLSSSVPPVCPVQLESSKFELCPYWCFYFFVGPSACGNLVSIECLVDIVSFFLLSMSVALEKKSSHYYNKHFQGSKNQVWLSFVGTNLACTTQTSVEHYRPGHP
jgi:hypothetical protein